MHKECYLLSFTENYDYPNLKNLTIPHIKPKNSQSGTTRRALAMEYIESNFPEDTWIRIYTDGSSENATHNGGAGILIQCPTENEERISLPAGAFATQFKAEVTAIQEATLIMQEKYTDQHIVILTDALSVLQALKTNKNKELNEFKSNIVKLSETNKLILQWIPSHCDLYGNEEADNLAKLGSKMTQNNKTTNYSEEKILIKANQQRIWKAKHPQFNKSDAYHQLTRGEQVIIFRLRTNHNRLKHHLFHKFRIGETDQCTCSTDSQTGNHILQSCPLLEELRKKHWPGPTSTSVNQKLYGSLEDLRRTAAFVCETGLTI